MREPDALDAARVLSLALLAAAGAAGLLAAGAPRPLAAMLQQAAFLLVPLVYARTVGLRPFAASGFRGLGLRQAVLVVLAAFSSLWILKMLADAQPEALRWVGLEEVARNEERAIQAGIESARRRGIEAALALLVVLPPICEETFFRGLVLRGLASRFGFPVAVGATALLFASMHGTVVQMGLMTVLGIFWAVLVRLTGSLWASVLAHAINNASVLLLTTTFGDALQSFRAPIWVLALAAALLGLSLRLLALEREIQADPPGGT